MRRVLGTSAYLAFLLCFTEVALQLFYYFTAGDFLFTRVGVPVWASNEWSGIGNRPGLAFEHRTNEFEATYFTNAQGFRVPRGRGDYAGTPGPDTARILLLGPSFAYGWGVGYEQTFAHQLEQMLQSAGWGGGRRVELINAGVPSLGIARQLNWYLHEGNRLAPELLIQFAYGSLAIKDELDVGTRVDAEGYLIDSRASRGKRIRAQAKRFATVFYAWMIYTRIDQALRGSDASGEVVGAGRELRLQGRFDPEAPAVQESLRVYRRLRDAAHASGSDLLLVYFPLSYAIHPEDESRWRHHGVLDVPALRAFDQAFCAHLNAVEGIRCLDITPALQRAAAEDEERLYYWLDVHWTARGNEVAARAVADDLLATR